MAALLPLLAAILLFLLYHRCHPDWCQSLLNTAIIYALLTFACVEGLSLVHALTFPGVATFWAVITLATAITLCAPNPPPQPPPNPSPASTDSSSPG